MQALLILSSPGSERGAAPSWTPARRAAEPGTPVESTRRMHDHGRHWHDGRRHAERGDHFDRGHEHGATRAELRLKIEQTFRQFSPTRAEGEGAEAQEGASTLSATLKARIRAVADDGRIDARLKISVQWNGEGDAASFAQALQQFTQTVFGALQTLFGQAPRVGTDATNAAPDADGNAAAAAATTAAAAVPATTNAPAAVAASTASADGVTPANAPPPSPIDSPIDSPTALPAAASESRQAAATPTSISIRLRLTYGGFAAQVPTLVQQLARPDVESRAPALQPLLEDMRSAWARLWGAAAGSDGPAPALATFLAALARNYSDGAPMAPLPAPGATTGALISTQA